MLLLIMQIKVKKEHTMLKQVIQNMINKLGYEIRKTSCPDATYNIPDVELYKPLFSPWLSKGEFGRYYNLAAPKTLVSADRCYVIYSLLRQAIHVDGDIWECGVYKGGTARMIATILQEITPTKPLYLFDTFEGMPETDSVRDLHMKGDFSDTTVEAVANYVGCEDVCIVRKGNIPETFIGLETHSIAFAHIDVDIYRAILDCLDFIWPRLTSGGFIVFDDYGFPSCPGARAAVDEFFLPIKCIPLCLPTGQAIVFKGVV